MREQLRGAADAADERHQLALALGSLYRWAGEQLPIHADKGGDYADEGVDGRMDCIDHATTTTRLLRLIEVARLAAPPSRDRAGATQLPDHPAFLRSDRAARGAGRRGRGGGGA